MSKYSGQYDFADVIEVCGFDYVARSIVSCCSRFVTIKTPRDAIPYYPYKVVKAIKDPDAGVFYLSDDPCHYDDSKKSPHICAETTEKYKQIWRDELLAAGYCEEYVDSCVGRC